MKLRLVHLLLVGGLLFWAGALSADLWRERSQARPVATGGAIASVGTRVDLPLEMRFETNQPDTLQLCAAQPDGPPTCISLSELRERRD